MAQEVTVYLHFPCFDGIVSAALASEYLLRNRGWQTRALVPVNYDRQAGWPESELSSPAAVVDFLYHPRAVFWADHHQTSFLTPALRARFDAIQSPDLLYDERASSCAQVLWRKVHRQLREPRFRAMVDWARRIDGAHYASVEEAVYGDAPALRISQSLLRHPTAAYCRSLVDGLRAASLEDVAASPPVAARYRFVREALLRGQAVFRRAARLESNRIAVFRLPALAEDTLVSRYAPYLEFPRARYSVGLALNRHGARITAMRNPWKRFKSLPLGEIFRYHGGGGHQRVASLLVNDARQAESTLQAIVKEIAGRDR